MESTLQEKIENLQKKQDLLGKKLMDVEIWKDGKAYVTNIYNGAKKMPDWVEGYLVDEHTFASVNEILDYYGLPNSYLNLEQFGSLLNNIRHYAYASINGVGKCWKLDELCEKTLLDSEIAYKYLKMNAETTFCNLVLHFRPNCYINLLGELVMPDVED